MVSGAIRICLSLSKVDVYKRQLRQQGDGVHDAGHEPDHERRHAADSLDRIASDSSVEHAGRRHDGVHAVLNADNNVVPHDIDDVHNGASCRRVGRQDKRGSGDRAFDKGPRKSKALPRFQKGIHRVQKRLVQVPRC